MSAMSLAKQAYSAFNREKPHSSITEWIEILTSKSYDDEAYDGIPELVDSISIQATGPAEASRAIRKKLKHGDSHQQYRALVILRALVENGGQKFQSSFADSQLTDAIKSLAQESATDPKVKKKLLAVLASWHSQFKDDPSMSFVANLYKQCKPADTATRMRLEANVLNTGGLDYDGEYIERKRREEREKREKKEEEKRKLKEAKEAEKAKLRQEEEARRRKATQSKSKRKPFNFEQEKPQILTSIASASQASSNLVNAITLVNTEHDSLQSNARVQECLEQAKVVRKGIVRYIQLVENEEMIGTLIETNERIIAALEMYDTLSKPHVTERDVEEVQRGLAAANMQDSELGKLQQKQRAAVQRSISRSSLVQEEPSSSVHPDLQDLTFGAPLGAEQSKLPPPIRPTTSRYSSDDDTRHGSLSDYSDYASSDEETHNRASGSGLQSARRRYVTVSDDDDVDARKYPKRGLLQEDDPFADPFAD
ncbi:hypothetical protein BXZ70DRAFT_290826 [Cristinia sonorae]|uniref:VHS domain-containing protein n=1 Tax=Cristinia sonorae TaxID=1940300 RepID=A0A8K0ULV4_9AGAR|nr:hypothetical protein BXZ70DRAFT_290826 [Cristinia sonorae]